MTHLTIPAPLSALAELKRVVAALEPSQSYAEMVPQFRAIAIALARAELEKATQQNALQPISSLPPEITMHIFGMARSMYDPMEKSARFPSLQISHVSHAWRVMAISMPSLWNILTSVPRRSLLFYDMLVKRSQMSVLDIHILASQYGFGVPTYSLLMLALSISHRWQRLDIQAPYEDMRRVISKLRHLSAPNLKHIRLASSTPESPNLAPHPHFAPLRILTGGAEKLSSFLCINIGWHTFRPPFAALTSLSFRCDFPVTYSSFCDALSEASATLTNVVLILWFLEADAPIRSIFLPSLLNMEVHPPEGHSDHIFTILATISAPRVDYITIIPDKPLRWSDCLSMFENLGSVPRYPLLTTLRICGAVGSGILRLFPTITRLGIIKDTRKFSHVGDLFDPDQEGFSTLVPRLSCVYFWSPYEADVRAFVAERMKLGFIAPELMECK